MGTPVELRVGGQSYRVLASADEAELRRLADVVDARLRSLVQPGRQLSSQSLVLAALALAHDLEEERAARQRAEEKSKQMLHALLSRIDAALGEPTAEPARGAGVSECRQVSAGPLDASASAPSASLELSEEDAAVAVPSAPVRSPAQVERRPRAEDSGIPRP